MKFSKSADRSAVLAPKHLKIKSAIKFNILNRKYSNFQGMLVARPGFRDTLFYCQKFNPIKSRAKISLNLAKIEQKLKLNV